MSYDCLAASYDVLRTVRVVLRASYEYKHLKFHFSQRKRTLRTKLSLRAIGEAIPNNEVNVLSPMGFFAYGSEGRCCPWDCRAPLHFARNDGNTVFSVKHEKTLRTKEGTRLRRIIRRHVKDNTLRGLWTVIVVLLTIILSLLTVGIVALRIGNTLPEGVDIFFIVPKNPDFHIEDKDGIWEAQNQVDIFSSEYVNGENQTTVLSQNGDDIIAPGTVSTYKFCMYNDGNMAIAYDLGFSFTLTIDGVEKNASSFPLSLRMTRTDGKYVMGGEDKWVNLDAGKVGEYDGILGASSYEQFTLEIMWAFEGNDELDTALGNAAKNSSVDLKFQIQSYAEENGDSTVQGGVAISQDAIDYNEYEFGGTIRWELFAILLALLALCVLYIVIWRL